MLHVTPGRNRRAQQDGVQPLSRGQASRRRGGQGAARQAQGAEGLGQCRAGGHAVPSGSGAPARGRTPRSWRSPSCARASSGHPRHGHSKKRRRSCGDIAIGAGRGRRGYAGYNGRRPPVSAPCPALARRASCYLRSVLVPCPSPTTSGEEPSSFARFARTARLHFSRYPMERFLYSSIH